VAVLFVFVEDLLHKDPKFFFFSIVESNFEMLLPRVNISVYEISVALPLRECSASLMFDFVSWYLVRLTLILQNHFWNRRSCWCSSNAILTHFMQIRVCVCVYTSRNSSVV
jgi:hypothetical protein